MNEAGKRLSRSEPDFLGDKEPVSNYCPECERLSKELERYKEPSSDDPYGDRIGPGLLGNVPAEPKGDVGELIERLRELEDWLVGQGRCPHAVTDALAELSRLQKRVEELDGAWIPLAENIPHVEETGGDYFWVMDGLAAPTIELAWYDGEDWYNPIGEGAIYGTVTHYQRVRKPRAAQEERP